MKNLRGLREAKKMTLKELGQIIGVAESTVSLYETGKREPDIATLTKLSKVFSVPIDFIVGENGVHWEHPSFIEDYWNASDDERVKLVERLGIDFLIASDYFNILGSPPPAVQTLGLDDFTYALQNEAKGLTDADKEVLLSMARHLKKTRDMVDGQTG